MVLKCLKVICPFKIFIKAGCVTWRREFKPIPHNLGCNFTRPRAHWWIQHTQVPPSGYLYSPTLKVFFFLSFCSFPFFHRLPPSHTWCGFLLTAPIITEGQFVTGYIISTDLEQKGPKWALSFTHCPSALEGGVLSALHAMPPPSACCEVSGVICVNHCAARNSEKVKDTISI